ncbi:MAG: hypothetical protein AAGB05_16880 [Pseudomonadota bacterium]
MISVTSVDQAFPEGLAGRAFALSGLGDDITVFFAVPAQDAPCLSAAPEAILPYAGILALVRNTDLDLGDMPVDPLLLRNVRCALAAMAQSHQRRHVPKILGGVAQPASPARGSECGVFFSGGIDSIFSLLRHRQGATVPAETVRPIAPVTRALHIYHTPEPVAPSAFRTLDRLAETVDRFGVRFLPVQSNIMTADRHVHDRWGDIGHGAGLATVLHILSGRLGTGIIGSSHVWGGLLPWGSGPVIDPLWSGRRLEVIHDDSTFHRVEKTEFVAQHPEAMGAINVCDIRVDGKGYQNCSRCQKCLRTMITLDLFGMANPASSPAFDWSDYTPGAFAKVFLRTDNDISYVIDIRDRSEALGRTDVMQACDTALTRARLMRPISWTEDTIKASPVGRRYRQGLKRLRDRGYRAVGLAAKSPVRQT